MTGIPERLWTLQETAAFLAIPAGTLYKLNHKGTGPPCYRVGKHCRYDPARSLPGWARISWRREAAGRDRVVASIADRWHVRDRDGQRRPSSRFGKGLRWQVRYRDPAGRSRDKSFARRPEAEQFLAKVRADLMRGEYVDPRAGRIPAIMRNVGWTVRHLKRQRGWPWSCGCGVMSFRRWGICRSRALSRRRCRSGFVRCKSSSRRAT
jgi:hypothetical protein